MKPRATKRFKRRPGSGVAVVEFALLLPLLLALLFGIVDFGFMLFDKAIVTNAAREAARAGIVLRTPRLGRTDIEGIARGYCRNRVISLTGGAINCEATATLPEPIAFSAPLEVAVTYRYDGPIFRLMSTLFGAGLAAPLEIRSSAVMRYE